MPGPESPLKVLHHSTRAQDHRAESYPEISDTVDALVKGMRALIDGKPIPPETVRAVEACEAVKQRFPKARE